MITESTIYWITRLDAIKDFFVFIIVLLAGSAAVWFISAVAYYNFHDSCEQDFETKMRRRCRGCLYAIYALVLCVVVNGFVPTTKEMLLIKGVPAVVSSSEAKCVAEDVGRLYKQLVKIIEEKMETNNDE